MLKFVMISIVYSVFSGGHWNTTETYREGMWQGSGNACHEVVQYIRKQLGAKDYRFESAFCVEPTVENE